MAAERLFRAKVIRFLSDKGLLSEDRVALLDSWRHSRMAEEQHFPLDFLARLLMHVPEPRLHLVRYRGHYSSVAL